MPKYRRRLRSRVARVLEQKRSLLQLKDHAIAAPEPTGSCRYADSLGQMQCESPVTQSYCDGKGGIFTQDARC
jgi:hypothetical protein